MKMMQKWYRKQFAEAGIKMQFAPEEGPDYFWKFGWKPTEFRMSVDEAQRLNRVMPMAWLWRAMSYVFSSRKSREQFRKNGYVLLTPA
jgi:hypothetical protein